MAIARPDACSRCPQGVGSRFGADHPGLPASAHHRKPVPWSSPQRWHRFASGGLPQLLFPSVCQPHGIRIALPGTCRRRLCRTLAWLQDAAACARRCSTTSRVKLGRSPAHPPWWGSRLSPAMAARHRLLRRSRSSLGHGLHRVPASTRCSPIRRCSPLPAHDARRAGEPAEADAAQWDLLRTKCQVFSSRPRDCWGVALPCRY